MINQIRNQEGIEKSWGDSSNVTLNSKLTFALPASRLSQATHGLACPPTAKRVGHAACWRHEICWQAGQWRTLSLHEVQQIDAKWCDFIMAILFTTDQQHFLNLNGTSQTTWRYRQGLNRKLQILFGKPAEFLPQVAIDRPGIKKTGWPRNQQRAIQSNGNFLSKKLQNVHVKPFLGLTWVWQKTSILLGITFLSW